MRVWRRFEVALSLPLLFAFSTSALAIDATNVLVLYNTDSPDGAQIANYYAQTHPGVHLLGLSGITPYTNDPDDISANNYFSEIRAPVMAALSPGISTIVTTKGMPLRVNLDPTTQAEPPPGPSGWPTYVDGNGVQRSIINWNATSSLESELTDVAKISTWQMMGDQSYLLGQFSNNPYYHSTSSFNQAAMGTYLTSRLDGNTASQVMASIDKAQHAFIGPNNTPNGPAWFLIDNDPTKNYAPTMAYLANNVVAPAGLPMVYDNTTAYVGTAPGPVIAYDSHGVHQASTPTDNYVLNDLNITLANGAIFNSWESFNAQSFAPGGNYGGQALVSDWLAKGGTAGVGNVAEPGASPVDVTNEDQLFKMMLSGKTFAEAAWSSERQLSYVNTVVGDPLMTWKQLLPADINMDGRVDISDLAILGADWGLHYAPGGYGWTSGDLNGDGVVDVSDLALLGGSWGLVSNWANGPAYTAGLTTTEVDTAYGVPNIPEPSSLVIGGIGAALLLGWRASRARR